MSPGRPRWVRASSSAPCCCSRGAWRGGPGGWWAGCGAAPPPPPSCCSRTSRCRSRPSSPRPAHLNEESDIVWPMWSRINFFSATQSQFCLTLLLYCLPFFSMPLFSQPHKFLFVNICWWDAAAAARHRLMCLWSQILYRHEKWKFCRGGG